jgi:hypothetical protein
MPKKAQKRRAHRHPQDRLETVQCRRNGQKAIHKFDGLRLTPSLQEQGKPMPKKSTKPAKAEKIAEMADRGKDLSAHFTNQFKVVKPKATPTIETAKAFLK